MGVLFLLKCELGPSVLIVCNKLYFFTNLIPYLVDMVEVIKEKKYKIKTEGLYVYIEFIKVINEIIIIKML